MTDERYRDLLSGRVIAVVGASTTPGKAAHEIPAYLLEHDYDIEPVNPFAETVHGLPAHDDVREVDPPVDIVNVFRPSDEVNGVVDATLERPDDPAIWLQRGIRNDEAAKRARDAGLPVVQDNCIKVTHRRVGQSS